MHPQRQSHRAFGLTFAAVFLIITAFAWFLFGVFLQWAPIVSGVLAAIALVRPKTLWPLNRLWAATAARLFSTVLNYAILAGMFFLVVLPVGLLRRLFGADTMGRRAALAGESYYRPVEAQVTADNLREIF